MSEQRFWDNRRGRIRSRAGGARIGEGVVYARGYSMLEELVGHVSFFQGLFLNVTGRLPERRLAEWVEATFLCMSWPDSRIWCNGVGAFGGTAQTSPVAAVAAGILASDANLYGPKAIKMAAQCSREGLHLRKSGMPVAEVVAALNHWPDRPRPVVPGFSRPISVGDERVPVMERVSSKLGFEAGEHLRLAFEIHTHFHVHYEDSINLGGYMAAFLNDQGLTPEEVYRLYSMCVNSGVHACYGEAFDNPPGAYLPLMCDDIEYIGTPLRSVPPISKT